MNHMPSDDQHNSAITELAEFAGFEKCGWVFAHGPAM